MRSKKTRIVVTGSFLSLLAVVAVFRKEAASSSQVLSSKSAKVAPAHVVAADANTTTVNEKTAPPASKGALFNYVNKPANAARVESLMAVPSHDVHYAQIDKSLVGGTNSPIAKQGARVEVALPDGTVLPVVITKTQSLGDQRYVSEGTINGKDDGRAVFAYNHGELSATVDDITHGSWQVRSIGNSTAQVFKVDSSLVPPCQANTKQLAALATKVAAASSSTTSSSTHAMGGDQWDPPAGAGPGSWKIWPNGWAEWVSTPDATPTVTPTVSTPTDSTQLAPPAGAGPGSWKIWPNGWTQWIPADSNTPSTPTVTETVSTPTPTPTPPVDVAPTVDTTPSVSTPAVNAWGNTQIRILVPYSKALENSMSSSAIASQIDLAIASLNNDLSRSGIPVTAVLAGAPALQYNQEFDQSGGAVVTALSRLASATDGIMDEVHIMRGETNADLVCFVMAQNDPNNSGVGYILAGAGDPANTLYGFSVVNFWYLNSNSTFSHEIGHNLGCNHDHDHAYSTEGQVALGTYPYSYGYRFYGNDGQQYRTIMSYAPGNVLPYFSNPNIWAWAPISAPVGAADAYNALTITQNASEVSYFHASRLVARTLTRLRGW